MPKIFEKIGARRPKTSSFDLSHEKKMSFNMGQLIPAYLQEILPGDRFTVKTETLLRLAPMIAPVMHRVDVTVHYFFVPNRITWKGWEDFITGGRDGDDASEMPVMNADAVNLHFDVGSLADYFGIPIRPAGYAGGTENYMPISQMPFRAYQKIWNEYFRDETINTPIVIDQDDWSDPDFINGLGALRNRSWQKDYFTSALPFTQRGAEINMPLEGTGSVTYTPTSFIKDVFGVPLANQTTVTTNVSGQTRDDASTNLTRIENIDEVVLDSSSVSINDFRVAHRLQKWLEKQARGGYRYIETLLSHFGVQSSDARLQRPEYLGGGTQHVIISEVLNTTGTVDSPQGQMSGHGISAGQTNSFSKRFEEHGYVIGIISVMPKTAYMQGMPRHFTRRDKLDYAWPEFAHLGEQEIKNREIYISAAGDETIYANAVFAYQQRYAEYKYAEDTVHGDFRDTLLFYHMARKFDTRPQFNEEFLEANPTHRIFAVDDEDPAVHKLWCQLYNNVKADRPLPYFGIPTI